MKTRRIYIREETFDAIVLPAAPVVGDKYPDNNIVESVEHTDADMDNQPGENVWPEAFRVVTADPDSGERIIRYCVVPFKWDPRDLIKIVMDNDEENIQHMTESQAADILSWLLRDDANNEIPEDLTASEFARIWNEIKETN